VLATHEIDTPRIGDELLLALPFVIMSGSPVLYVRLQ
jgi:hypothetical protein